MEPILRQVLGGYQSKFRHGLGGCGHGERRVGAESLCQEVPGYAGQLSLLLQCSAHICVQGCQVFAYSSKGYTNCQLTRQGYNYISRSDKVKDAKWDIYELRSRGGDDSIYFPSDNQSKS